MKRYITMLLSLLLTLSLVSCSGDSKSGSSKATMPKEGSSVTLDNDSVVLTSKKNVDKVIDFVQAKNNTAIDRMFSNGEAITIKKGEKVDIIDSGTVVEIEYLGKRYFSVYEAIQ